MGRKFSWIKIAWMVLSYVEWYVPAPAIFDLGKHYFISCGAWQLKLAVSWPLSAQQKDVVMDILQALLDTRSDTATAL